ncbi:MAG TPA: ornithine cyclodeaminase family protein [Burkholderiales bacterium]|nr:ornithine cyclodeaminase family protein [Burkholderiales bacterium]
MVRYLTEQDIQQLLTMDIALEYTERSLRDRALGRAIDIPRVRTHIPQGIQHVLQAAAPDLGWIGFKYYYTRPGQSTRAGQKTFFVHLLDIETTKLAAIIEAGWMSMLRTGAASGVATRYLANEDASIVGQIGAGFQGIGQLEAVCAVRRIREARIYARNRDKLEAFCRRMSQQLGIGVIPAASARAAVQGAHILNVITKSVTPVLLGEWLEPGQHINAAGSNALKRREIDEAAVGRCKLVTVDSRDTARGECGDLLPLVEQGRLEWDRITEIGEVMTGDAPGRAAPTDITLYESHGMGVQDLYVGARMLELARERGVGTELPIGGH